MRSSVIAAVSLSLMAISTPCAGVQSLDRHELDAAPWVNDLSLVALNSALSGLFAATRRVIGGGDFWPAFRQGSIGGVVTYGGKRLASLDGAAALWTSHVVGAAGIAMVDNAGDGLGPFDRLYLPLGPLALELDIAGGMRVGLSVNVRDVVAIAEAVQIDELSFNWRRSLKSGFPVFDAENRYLTREGSDGRARGGVVLIESDSPAVYQRILRHEATHILQNEYANRLVGNPLERALVARVRGKSAPAWLRVGFLQVGWTYGLYRVGFLGDYQRPFELEAQWVEYN